MGGGLWVDQGTSAFPLVGVIPEPGVYSGKGDPSPAVSASEPLSGARKRCKARFYDSRSPRESKLWDGALLQVEKSWLEGPFAVIEKTGEDFQVNPA